MRLALFVLPLVLAPVTATCQLSNVDCEAVTNPVEICAPPGRVIAGSAGNGEKFSAANISAVSVSLNISAFNISAINISAINVSSPNANAWHDAVLKEGAEDALSDLSAKGDSEFISPPQPQAQQHFHWGRALLESFELLSIEQAYVVHDDWNWVGGKASENGIPFNHYWRDYKQSLQAWVHSGWNDGDPNMYGYVGHPIQGVATSYIFLQNDPKYEKVEFSKSKEYWRSRFKATIFNAVYSTQWNLGPISEPTVEKYGTLWRDPWNRGNSMWRYTGMGQIDLVMTPVGGFGWMVGLDIVDRFVTRRVEASTQNRFLIDVTRCGLDPIRIGTNLLHGKRPWYRPRDAREMYVKQLKQIEGPGIDGNNVTPASH